MSTSMSLTSNYPIKIKTAVFAESTARSQSFLSITSEIQAVFGQPISRQNGAHRPIKTQEAITCSHVTRIRCCQIRMKLFIFSVFLAGLPCLGEVCGMFIVHVTLDQKLR